MKNQTGTNRLTMGVTMAIAMAFATTASAKNPKEVSLEISDNQLIMKTKKDENDCPFVLGELRQDGCIQLKKNEKSEIYFHLQGDTKCTLESGTDWKLNAVYLGGFDSKSKPPIGDYGFDTVSDAEFNMVNGDFNIADRKTGLVTNVDKKDKKITINDNNQYKYSVWYRIEAICEREDGMAAHVAAYDPRVKNEGTE